MTRLRLPIRRPHVALPVISASAPDDHATSHLPLKFQLAVHTILGETLVRVERAFLVRVIVMLRCRDVSFRRVFDACSAITTLTEIGIAAAVVEPRLRLLCTKIENSPIQEADAMAPLQNLRQETFCQLVAAGNSATAAYASAYGRTRDPTSRVNGPRLLADACIWERIAEIRREEAHASFPLLRQVIEEAGQAAIREIETGSPRRACQAAERFAHMIIRLSA